MGALIEQSWYENLSQMNVFLTKTNETQTKNPENRAFLALIQLYQSYSEIGGVLLLILMRKRTIVIPPENRPEAVRIFVARQGSADDAGQEGPIGGADAGT